MRVTFSPPDTLPPRRKRSKRRSEGRDRPGPVKRWRRIVPEAECPEGTLCHVKQVRSIQLCASVCFFLKSSYFCNIHRCFAPSSSSSLAVQSMAPPSSCVPLRLWVHRPGGPGSKFTSCWTASILTSAAWGARTSAMSPTHSCTC